MEAGPRAAALVAQSSTALDPSQAGGAESVQDCFRRATTRVRWPRPPASGEDFSGALGTGLDHLEHIYPGGSCRRLAGAFGSARTPSIHRKLAQSKAPESQSTFETLQPACLAGVLFGDDGSDAGPAST